MGEEEKEAQKFDELLMYQNAVEKQRSHGTLMEKQRSRGGTAKHDDNDDMISGNNANSSSSGSFILLE